VQLDRHWIEQHIPHRGRMCLLEEVLAWDANQARCRSSTHRSLDNPLRAFGRLGAASGIEYAAQTMAVHGALLAPQAGQAAPAGFLASVRNVQLHVDRLDDIENDLVATVERITSDAGTALYEFSVAAAERTLLSGRAAIAFIFIEATARGAPAAS
jgi:predicted hotdog family 3-hydroxylacyl-ACP dehydratase